MTTTLRTIADLAVEAAERLTSEQLFALAGMVAAAEARPPEPEPVRTFDAELAFDIDGTLQHVIDLWGPAGVGCEIADIASSLWPRLVRLGVAEADVLAAIERVTGWHPRTPEDRERAVARAMLADGWAPDVIARALQETELVPC